jgi:hypothetical protein
VLLSRLDLAMSNPRIRSIGFAVAKEETMIVDGAVSSFTTRIRQELHRNDVTDKEPHAAALVTRNIKIIVSNITFLCDIPGVIDATKAAKGNPTILILL